MTARTLGMLYVFQEQKLEAYPMLEVYEKNDKVHFLAPLDHQEEFFVPEARQKEDTGDYKNE